jgi:histone-lysine N-methyltransferase SETD1
MDSKGGVTPNSRLNPTTKPKTTGTADSPQNLVALSHGESVNIMLVVNGMPFAENETLPVVNTPKGASITRKRTRSRQERGGGTTSPASSEDSSSHLKDHNLFHCHVCHKFGSVVCCDNCPHVYHKNCIPEGHPSRISLDNDEDPWFCPSCHPRAPPQELVCLVCYEEIPESTSTDSLNACTGCGGWIHDSCINVSKEGVTTTTTPPLVCDKCQDAKSASNKIRGKMTSATDDDTPPLEKKRKIDPETKITSGVDAKPPKIESNSREEENTADDAKPNGKNLKKEPVAPTMITRRTRSASVSEGVKNASKKASENEKEETDEVEVAVEQEEKLEKAKSISEADIDGNSEKEQEEERGEEEEEDPSPVKIARQPRKRRRLSLPASQSPSPRSESTRRRRRKKEKEKEKKKKKGKSSKTLSSFHSSHQEEGSQLDSHSQRSYGGPATATPAFFFFLAENRSKIERSLSRRHRYFNRLPKGYERNELVAKEGANWWFKLRQSELKRFMNQSMRDFEQRIIKWKEEKSIREMVDLDGGKGRRGDKSMELTPDDEHLTYQNHERLYLGTTVGCKPFKVEPGVSHNRILLELLQDMRFHPLPMFLANRTKNEYGQMDFSRITIPYFDVHGPVSTSLGDECLGCTRGWAHYCNVLKRKIPAIEHRAKLQPPLSSLMATRVGLGLQPSQPQNINMDSVSPENVKDLEMYSIREDPEVVAAKNLPVFRWEGLTDPGTRADDIVQFIEETVAMKVPEPPRPSYSGKSEIPIKPLIGRGVLPMRGRKESSVSVIHDDGGTYGDDAVTATVNKCGRCRTIIQTDTGCIQCRRAQLVINMSKRMGEERIGSHGDDNTDDGKLAKFLKVSTYMLGRVNIKEGSEESQSENDLAISNGILRQRWTPFAVLPSKPMQSPTPKPIHMLKVNDNNKVNHKDNDKNIDKENGKDNEQDNDSDKKELGSSRELSDSETGKKSSAPGNEHESNNASSTKPTIEENSEDSQEDGKSPMASNKRLRSARIGTQTVSDPSDDLDRQAIAEMQKEESDRLHKKCLQIACCGILLGLMRRDPLLLFANPVTAEGYSSIIKHPIDFGKIKSTVLGAKYASLGSFASDARLLCTNALTYNPPGSIYWKTAKELYGVLAVMQKRASDWMVAIKNCHAQSWRRRSSLRGSDEQECSIGDLFDDLRKKWPEAVDMLENNDWLRKYLSADFMRTKENETAYYGGLAIRRAAIAAEASLAPYPDQNGVYNTVGRRSHTDDDNLRTVINERVANVVEPLQLKDLPTWREDAIVRVMRRAQSRRLDGLIGSVNGCARCDGMRVDQELKMAMTAETLRWGRTRRKNNEVARVHSSRIYLSTGLGSKNIRATIKEQRKEMTSPDKELAQKTACAQKAAVIVKGSRIHGWGLYADQPFKAGDIVGEYIGEYVSLAVTEAREKMYQEQRIQDYQFRLDDQLVIDATIRGGHGRYINHNCSPNCIAKIIRGEAPNEDLKRVLIVAQREIKPREELTYDYQFPLEHNFDARIPCNCHSEHCRGFMNWDLPEKGSNSRIFRSQKRGANMRDRIRRLGRPLKGDKHD